MACDIRQMQPGIRQSASNSEQLVLLKRASAALASAKSLSDIKDVRDKAEAVRHYAKSVAVGLEMHNHAAEIKLRAERKAGELLASLHLRGGDRKSKHHGDILTLKELGIDGNQSARWQREAAVPEDEFERYINEANATKKEISTAGLLAIATNLAPSRRRPNTRPAGISMDVVDPSLRVKNVLIGNDGEPLYCIVQEANDHIAVLAKILDPIRKNVEAKLTRAECRHVGRLLLEIERALNRLQEHFASSAETSS